MALSVRYKIGILAGLFATISALAQEMEGLSRTVFGIEIRHSVFEQIGTNLVQVFYRYPEGTLAQKTVTNTGTGFFIKHGNCSYIVTAKHIAQDAQLPGTVTSLLLVNRDGARIALPLVEIQTLLPAARWFVHPEADVAIYPYSWPDQLKVSQLDLPDTMLRTNALELLSPVSSVGFPFGWGLGPRISPIAAECQLASWQTELPTLNPQCTALTYILLDKALAQGYSGAPIFTRAKPIRATSAVFAPFQTEIIGICSAQQADVGGGKVAVVVPAIYMLEIFNSKEFLAYQASLPR